MRSRPTSSRDTSVPVAGLELQSGVIDRRGRDCSLMSGSGRYFHSVGAENWRREAFLVTAVVHASRGRIAFVEAGQQRRSYRTSFYVCGKALNSEKTAMAAALPPGNEAILTDFDIVSLSPLGAQTSGQRRHINTVEVL